MAGDLKMAAVWSARVDKIQDGRSLMSMSTVDLRCRPSIIKTSHHFLASYSNFHFVSRPHLPIYTRPILYKDIFLIILLQGSTDVAGAVVASSNSQPSLLACGSFADGIWRWKRKSFVPIDRRHPPFVCKICCIQPVLSAQGSIPLASYQLVSMRFWRQCKHESQKNIPLLQF